MVAVASDSDGRRSLPRLIAVSGPLAGEVIPLHGDVTVGRDTNNAICVADLSVSRTHCAIVREGVDWQIRDRNSSNGTFVNGAQVVERKLVPGDHVAIGESEFVFIAAPRDNAPIFSEDRAEVLTRIPLAGAGAPPNQMSDRWRREHRLEALLEIAVAVNSIRNEGVLAAKLAELLASSTSADETAVISTPPGAQATILAARQDGREATIILLRHVLHEAISSRQALLTRDISEKQGFPNADRGVAAGAQSVLCVPLAVRDRVLGALYLATTHAHESLDEGDLRFVTAVANVAALAIDNVRQIASLETETERLRVDTIGARKIVGQSAAMNRIYDRIARVARTDQTTVLITGETGTGKELVARALHLNSDRAKGPFVAINCAALSEALLETELFGHERGAFTGAVAQKKGKLELANGGTVFLDEVSELTPTLQGKLLRALQERECERVGGTRAVSLNIRVVSASNRILRDEVAAKRFREDLYHRLNVVHIDVPPLRERREDIRALANYFLGRFARKAGRPISGISDAALKLLVAYDWPGNVRELENTIERALVLGSSEFLLPEELPEELFERASVQGGLGRFHDGVREIKRRLIVEAFRDSGRRYTETARLLGLHPNYLHRLIRNLDLKSVLEQDS